jgi:two-component system response regulator (stage 0 sporulation protein F)
MMEPTTIDVGRRRGPAIAVVRPLVVIVEDDDDFRDLVCVRLAGEGLELLPLGDGAEARDYIDLAYARPLDVRLPSVLITDLLMPGMNGLDLIAVCAAIPTIAMTAFGGPATTREARSLGARHVFSKPFDFDELRTAVRRLIDG